MLPLVQMHQMVQAPPHLDFPSSLPSNIKHDNFAFLHTRSNSNSSAGHSLTSNQRIFPIRASQAPPPTQHPRAAGFTSLSTSSTEHNEHHLRRKTPNGTIDAGYDGTPTQLASGPPPLKHMILPSTSHSSTARNGWPYRPSSTLSPHDTHAFSSSWHYGVETPARSALPLDCAPNLSTASYFSNSPGIVIPTALHPSYQQLSTPAVFHNGSLLPPSAWSEKNPSHYSSPGYIASLGNTPIAVGHHAPRDQDSKSANRTLATLGQGSNYDGNAASFQSPAQRLEMLTLDSSRYLQDTASPTRFREKALSSAHRAYVELLGYLHQSRKAHQGRASTGSRNSTRMIIFPKLPKRLNQAHSVGVREKPRALPASYIAFGHDDHPERPHVGTTLPYTTPKQHRGPVPHDSQFNGGFVTQGPPDSSTRGFYHMFPGDSAPISYANSLRRQTWSSPLSNAKGAVEMLSHLCEQSGWKWIDGIILGGCLHYGLEHYEQALEWFSRILEVDANHFEALANVAATLYYLNRYDEAERQWLKAIRTKPSNLEAVEHLVGLLCSTQRNKEAVDMISFVQESLRSTNSATLDNHKDNVVMRDGGSRLGQKIVSDSTTKAVNGQTDDSGQPGFASSGYRVAGSENGRMIALIHAKGNMLYTLKEISRAAEAFEEAVVISAGRTHPRIESIIRKTQSVLSPQDHRALSTGPVSSTLGPLLLAPERARHTAQLVFAPSGELPGLQFVHDGFAKRSAVSTTSNSLLSLAKIFQDAASSGSPPPGLLRQSGGVGDILALYYLSLSLSESPSTANNVGILLASIQPSSSVQQEPSSEGWANPSIPGIHPGSGLALALAYYHYGLSLDPRHVHLHTNLGSLLKDIGQLDMAIQMYEQAVACDGNFDIALTNLANAVKDKGRVNDAIMYYKRAVEANPNFAEAVCGLSTALNSVCDWRRRGGVLLHRGKYDRWHVDSDGMLRDAKTHGASSGLMRRVVEIVSKQLTDSSYWGRGVLQAEVIRSLTMQLRAAGADETDGGLELTAELRSWAGRPWEGTRIVRLVERSIKSAMRLWYRRRYLEGDASFPGFARPRVPSSISIPSAPTVLPFHTFTCPLTARDIRMISQRNALRISCSTLRSPWLPDTVYPPPPPPNPQLNIGYISSDFNNHPLAHLMQSVFGFHNPSRARAFCYATTASDKSVHRQQIEREAPVFRDVSTWSAERLVEQVVKDQIHILVNLNGYTRGARNEVFAARPAPIQMSFMGFAGTLGAEWCDYLLADETAIPRSTLRPVRANTNLKDVFRDEKLSDAEDWVYSENIIFCRDTFFCCDHAQSCEAEDRSVSWHVEQERRWQMRKELFPQLPDDTIILGNFNQLYKIDPSTFRTWLRILANVPNAILWLLRFPELGENNLRRTAKAWAGEDVASRIYFTDVAPKQQHISRARVCDLFLDTAECNAHTTAADVLWSSTPLLTLPRYPYKMCSRMAASILKGALPKNAEGLQAARELIAADDTEYEELATKLAGSLQYQSVNGRYCEGRGRLAELRRLLFDSRWTCALFDTRRWVADLEDAYDEAWRRWVAGETGDIYLQ